MTSVAKNEAKGIGLNLLTLLAQAALPAFHVQLARRLGEGGYGVYAWSNTFVDMFSILTLFGMDQAVMRSVSLANGNGEDEKAVTATGTALRVVVLSGVLVSFAIFVAAPWLAAKQGKPNLTSPLRVLALVPIFYHVTTIFLVATQARHVMKYNFWVRGLVQPLGLLLLTTLALRFSPSVSSAAAAVAIGMATTSVCAAIFYGRELPLRATLQAALRGPLDRPTLWLALPLVLTNLVWALQGRVDALYLGHYRGSAEMGAYAACVLYVASISQLRGSFDPVVCAAIPPALASGDIKGLNASIQRQTRWLAMMAMPLVVLFAGFGDPLLSVFGKGFARGATAMAVLSLGHLASTLSLASFVIPMSGHARYGALAAGFSVALQAAVLPRALAAYGATGAAISFTVGMVAAQGVQAALAYKFARVHGFSFGLLKVAGAAIAAYFVGRFLYGWFEAPLLSRFLLGVCSAAVVYLALLFLFGLGPEEKAVVARTRARIVAFRRRGST